MRIVRFLVLVTVLCVAATPASAAQITGFGQSGVINQFFSTDNGDGTTSLDVFAVLVGITNIASGPLDPAAIFEFHAESLSDAQFFGPLVVQDFAGTFTLHNVGNTITYLEGTFGGALQLGVNGGTNSLFTSNSGALAPLVLSSSLFSLANPESFSLSLSNLDPAFATNTYDVGGVEHTTIASFTASFTGTADAEFATAVPEPASLLLLGTGLVGLAARARRRGGK